VGFDGKGSAFNGRGLPAGSEGSCSHGKRQYFESVYATPDDTLPKSTLSRRHAARRFISTLVNCSSVRKSKEKELTLSTSFIMLDNDLLPLFCHACGAGEAPQRVVGEVARVVHVLAGHGLILATAAQKLLRISCARKHRW